MQPNSNLTSPAMDAVPVSPNDSTDLSSVTIEGNVVLDHTRALMITTAGNIKVTMHNGNTRTISVPVGIIPIRVRRVWLTGTTASGITALY
jgi:hypothetical protein